MAIFAGFRVGHKKIQKIFLIYKIPKIMLQTLTAIV